MLRSTLVWLLGLAPLSIARADELVPAETHAVIVGVLEWKHGLTPYPKRNRKDLELRDLLLSRGTPPANIALLLDEQATLANIRDAIGRTAQAADPDSTLLVYYAGHGMPAGDSDYCFANYEMDPQAARETGWKLSELGDTLAEEFEGNRVLLCADCCYSGGLEIVVERLAAAGIAAANLTSASRANSSTNNWTFTQSLIDGLRGEPLVDANADGEVTLGELDVEVREAMRHLEGQLHGYRAAGIADDFVVATSTSPRFHVLGAKFSIGSYVVALDGRNERTGRVVAVEDERYTVQFYDYSDKRTAAFDVAALTASTRDPAQPPAVLDAGIEPDCEVQWGRRWWPAKLLEKKDGKFFIHYLGYEASWDEWVGEDRIRFAEEQRKKG